MSNPKRAKTTRSDSCFPRSPQLLRLIVGKLPLNDMVPLTWTTADLAIAARAELSKVTNLALVWSPMHAGFRYDASMLAMYSTDHGNARILRVRQPVDYKALAHLVPNVEQLDLTESIEPCPIWLVSAYAPKLRSLCCGWLEDKSDEFARRPLRKLERLVCCSEYSMMLRHCPELRELQVFTRRPDQWCRELSSTCPKVDCLRLWMDNVYMGNAVTTLRLPQDTLRKLSIRCFLDQQAVDDIKKMMLLERVDIDDGRGGLTLVDAIKGKPSVTHVVIPSDAGPSLMQTINKTCDPKRVALYMQDKVARLRTLMTSSIPKNIVGTNVFVAFLDTRSIDLSF